MVANHVSRFKVLEPTSAISVDRKTSDEAQYWRCSEQFSTTVKEHGAVTHVAFQKCNPHYFAVTASSRIELYNSQTSELVKTFSRFHDTAYSGNFRTDGQLLVAGNEDTKVRLFDVEGRVPLRIFKGHTRPVHVTDFCSNLHQVFSASDDQTVRLWDIATEETLNIFNDHKDYIRCGCRIESVDSTIVTGSYDHTVRCFDARSNSNTITVDHGCPVEAVLAFPSGTVLLSAGGTSIKVWDLLQGGKLLAVLENHHKTITSMTFNHNHTRLLSASLDRHVKIYDVATYQVVHNIDYPGAILSVALSPNADSPMVVGMADKMLSIRLRKKSEQVEKSEADVTLSRKKRRERALFMRGQNFVPNHDDVIIDHKKRDELQKYDLYFRKFEHSKALDAALLPHVHNKTPEVTVAVLEELIRRDTIRAALAGRDEKKLILLIKFLCRNVTKSNFAPVLMDVAELLIDIYTDSLDESAAASVRGAFMQLRHVIKREVRLQLEMQKLLGCVEAITSVNHATAAHQLSSSRN